ncbi:MAG: PASTA domain-containing protein [Deltaproteobacteria bacterium]|nr:PASTA domain-containing protein [Deltaproteobacteria bacterium]
MQYPEAVKRLEAAGFKHRFSTKGPKQIRNGVVVSIVKRQDPAGGATVPNGTNLKLFFQ